jgi:uncharacterized membrane protein YgcG
MASKRPPFILRLSIVAVLLVGAWLLWLPIASAQTWPELDGAVADDTGQLNAEQIEQINNAAESLRALGYKPLALLSQNGQGFSGSEAFARAAAEQYGFGTTELPDADLLAVVVILDSRQSRILYGDRLKPVMERSRDGSTVAQQLLDNSLNPQLQAGDFAKGFADTFTQAAREVELYRNPPTPVPPSITNIDTGGLGSALLWGIVIIVAVIVLAIAGPLLYRRWRAGQEAEARRQALQGQLLQARNVAADMITDLDLPADPNEQLQFRFLALTLENKRPEELARITDDYEQRYRSVSEALARYNTLNEGRYTTEEEMTQAIAGYQGVQNTIRNANAYLEYLSDYSSQIEARAAAAPGEADAAKKAIAAATDELARLSAAAPDLYPPDPETTLRPAREALARTEAALNPERAMPLRAYDLAVTARSQADVVAGSARFLSQAYADLAVQREQLSQARNSGFKLPLSDQAFAQTLELLSEASRRLESGETEAFDEALQKARGATQLAASTISEPIGLQAANEKALADLEEAGEEIKAYIAEGAAAFDQVDEYAESSWDDIRGNGTEAQRDADDAFRLWQQASALNAITPDSPQDFSQAQELIGEAQNALAEARAKVAAILDRLKNLEESKRTARSEIEAAERDIAAGTAFVAKYDPDITPQPAQALVEASALLEQAKSEVARKKPDWIEVVSLARRANDTADRALAEARTQQEAMAARRQRVQTLSQQAAASASRAENYASVHRADLDRSVFNGIAEARQAFERGEGRIAQADRRDLEDVALGKALDEAATLFAQAQQTADTAYSAASTQFAAMEGLRQEAYGALQRADTTIRETAGYIEQHRGMVGNSSIELINSAIELMPAWQDGADRAHLSALVARAQEAEAQADKAYRRARREVQEHTNRQRERQMQDALSTILTAGALASALGGGGRRRRSGWGGGWGIPMGAGGGGGIFGGGGGGSIGGGWGGGGSSGGGWGGGGSSGGSWGGGGSTGGGW